MRESHRNVRRIYAVLKGHNIEWFSQLHSNIFGSVLVKFGLENLWKNMREGAWQHELIMHPFSDNKDVFDNGFMALLVRVYERPEFLEFLDDLLDKLITTQNIVNFEYDEFRRILKECHFEDIEIEKMKCWKNESKIQEKVEKKIIFQDIIQDINRNFRKIVKSTPQKEKDVQDDLETFFDVKEYDFSREQEKVGFSDKSFEPDFTHEVLNIALEVKFVDKPEKKKSVIDEMSADIKPYSKRWKNILFLVYDVGGNIRDVDSYVKDFIQDREITIRCIVIKH